MKIEINSTPNEANPFYETWKRSLSNEDKMILLKTLGEEIKNECRCECSIKYNEKSS